jgi:hypothetical protein
MRLFLPLLLVLLPFVVHGQFGRKELRTDTGLVVLHHFKTGEVSTMEWMDVAERFGLATAYDRSGKEIFRFGTRRIGGHASVHFSYHPNGAISKAESSDAPDAGIQWYRSTTTFDDQGDQTGFWKDSHEDLISPSGPFTLREQPSSPVVTPPKQAEVMACQRLFLNEVFVVNGSSWPVEITVEPRDPSPALQGSKFVLPAGESKLVGTYSVGETFVSPVQRMKVTGRVTNKRGKQRQVGVLMMEDRQVDPQRKAWFYHVMPNGGRVGFGF